MKLGLSVKGNHEIKMEVILKRTTLWDFVLPALLLLLFIRTSAVGYDITDKFSISGVLAGAYQYQLGDDIEDKGRGAIPFQPE